MFVFGFFDALEVGAAGGAHSGMTVGISGELIGTGRVVEGEVQRGEQRCPPRFRPRRGSFNRGVSDNQSSYPIAMCVKPLIELG